MSDKIAATYFRKDGDRTQQSGFRLADQSVATRMISGRSKRDGEKAIPHGRGTWQVCTHRHTVFQSHAHCLSFHDYPCRLLNTPMAAGCPLLEEDTPVLLLLLHNRRNFPHPHKDREQKVDLSVFLALLTPFTALILYQPPISWHWVNLRFLPRDDWKHS